MNEGDIPNSKIFENSIKSMEHTIQSTNNRMNKLIDPFIKEINEDKYKLRKRKDVNYQASFDLSFLDEDSQSQSKYKKRQRKSKKEKESSEEEDEEVICYKKKIRVLKKINLKKKSFFTKKRKIFETVVDNTSKKKKDFNNNPSTINTEFEIYNYEYSNNCEDKSLIDKNSEKLSILHTDDEFVEFKKDVIFDDIKKQILQEINESKILMEKLEIEFFLNNEKISNLKSKYSDDCIPICADIRNFDFQFLADKQKELTNGRLFDVIMMDPPWQLSSSQPTRGVAIAYDTLNDNIITDLPIEILQNDGFIFIWTINAKFKTSLDLMKKWGYTYHDEIVWVKQTVNGKIAKGHGYYLQHTKETCLIGKKGNPFYERNVVCDVIFSKRRGQSQKPEEIYKYIETLIPNGFYLEIFGRRNNLRENWVTLGNEL